MKQLAMVVLMFLLATSVGAKGQGKTEWKSPVPVDKVKLMVSDLEADPLGEHADGLRAVLLKYFDNMRPEFNVCLGQFKPLLDTEDEAQKKLWLHVPIGSGAYLLDHPEDIENEEAYQREGMEAMLRVYEKMLAGRPATRHAFLDQLLGLRDAGKLADHVRAHRCE